MKMLRRIVLENFMSHIRTELELSGGLTVLVGPNNCGKSAVVEAIRTVCENTSGDFMVRHGEKQCRVLIETDDGHVIEWKRDKAVVSYTIDGRDIHRLGGGVPEDLHALLKLPFVQSLDGRDQFDIHIAGQKSPLFLLDRPGRESAMFFASSSDAALLMEMQAKHKKRVTERKRDESQFAKAQLHCQQQLECLSPIQQVDETLRTAEALYEQICKELETMRRLTADLGQLERQLEQVRQANDWSEALQPLPAPPELSDTRVLVKLLDDMFHAEFAVARGEESCKNFSTLSAPPPLADIESLAGVCRQLPAATIEVARGEDWLQAMRDLGSPSVLADTEHLATLCDLINRQKSELDYLTGKAAELSNLLSPPEQDDLAGLANLIAELGSGMNSYDRIESRLSVMKAIGESPELTDLAKFSTVIESLITATKLLQQQTLAVQQATDATGDGLTAIREWAAVNPNCPVCGEAVNVDDLTLAGGHDHA